MNIGAVIGIVIAAVALIFGGIYFVIPRAIKKGIDVSGAIDVARNVTTTSDALLDGLKKIFPDIKALDIVDTIVGYAAKAVDAAEQMWAAHLLEKDSRKEKAEELTYAMLALAGIEVDDQVKRVVDGAIEAAVLYLPHLTPEADSEDADD